jgi:hypothetical protein
LFNADAVVFVTFPINCFHVPAILLLLQYGSYLCDSPPTLIDSVMKFMRLKTGDEADFILWTG